LPIALRTLDYYLGWEEEFSWLAPEEIPSDPLKDFRTTGNCLSIWIIENADTDLHRIIAALNAKRSEVNICNYILFDPSIYRELGIKEDLTILGDTPDNEINHCHVDLVELSAQKLISLIHALKTNFEPDRIQTKELCQFVVDSVKKGWIDRNKLNRPMVKEIRRYFGDVFEN
jgi:hypothetical protein